MPWHSADRHRCCPVCGGIVAVNISAEDKDYSRCRSCKARFLEPTHFLSRDQELAHYRHHENRVNDPGYRRFLLKLFDPLIAKLPRNATGLDFGCGPGPALAAMLREAGHLMEIYDPFFAPDPAPLERVYDFVTCSEVAEHFYRPKQEFERLRGLIRPRGWLAIMTSFQTDDARFVGWHYRRDPTHVVFYREETFCYLARSWGWSCVVPVKDVVLMQAPVIATST